MAGERLVLVVACALTAIGAISAPIVSAEPKTATRRSAPRPRLEATSPPVVTSTTLLGSNMGVTSTTAPAASPEVATSQCAGAAKHGPLPADATFVEFPRKKPPQRRVLATGRYADTVWWRLVIERDDTYGEWNLVLGHEAANGGGYAGTDPTKEPLFVSGTSLGGTGVAYFGKAGPDAACVAFTAKNGVRVVVDELYSDSAYRDGLFYVLFVACSEAGGGVIESFDGAGKRTGKSPAPSFDKKYCSG